MKMVLTAVLLILGFQAHADLGVGALLSGAQDSWESSGPGLNSLKSDGMTTRFGVMFWLPVAPGLSMRVGYLRETEKVHMETLSGDSNLTVSNYLVPINLQLGLPVTDLYVFGGGIFATNDKVDPAAPWGNDVRVNAGVGYPVVDLGPGHLNVELEYEKGTKNLNNSPGFETKNQSIAVNISAQFGF